MGQKITEFPQVDYWVKLTKEADKAGATLPHRGSADRKELSQYAEMERARSRSVFSVSYPPTQFVGGAGSVVGEQKYDSADDGDEVASDDAPGDDDGDDEDEAAEEEESDDGEASGA